MANQTWLREGEDGAMAIFSERILIIEDDHDVGLATKINLELAGYKNIGIARSGDAGLKEVKQHKPALILLDRKMPNMDGLEVLDRIKEEYGDDIEVVMLTAYRDKDYVLEAMRKGAFSYLVKDEDPDLNLKQIEQALRFNRKSRRLQSAEQEIYDLLIDNEELLAEGYKFPKFQRILQDKVSELIDGVVETKVVDCTNCASQRQASRTESCFSTSLRILNEQLQAEPKPRLTIKTRASGSAFYEQTATQLLEPQDRERAQAMIFFPFVEKASKQLSTFLRGSTHNGGYLTYCCIYIFLNHVPSLSIEERRQLRSFFSRVLIAIRMSMLVDRVNSLNKNQLLGTMSTNIVHYISPLIMPLMDCLEKGDQSKGVEIVKELHDMVNDFRHFTDGIVKEYAFTVFDIVKLVKESYMLHSMQFETPIPIEFNTNQTSILVEGDRDRLRQVFITLLRNANYALTQGNSGTRAEIHMLVAKKTGFVEIRVRDNGPGIAETHLPKLFNTYFTTKAAGMGLGLPLSREILHRHMGSIVYNSEFQDGAEFIVTLPLASMTQQAHIVPLMS